MGIAARYNQLKGPASARNVKSMGGTGSHLTSIYFISHAVFHGIYPKASKVGLSKTDKGQVTKVKDDGSMYEVYRTHYKWQVGTTLDDWRGCARICNISVDPDNMVDGQALIKAMIAVKNNIEAKYLPRVKAYLTRDLMTVLENAALDKSSAALSITSAAEQFRTNFFGIPLEVCDAISTSEVQVK